MNFSKLVLEIIKQRVRSLAVAEYVRNGALWTNYIVARSRRAISHKSATTGDNGRKHASHTQHAHIPHSVIDALSDCVPWGYDNAFGMCSQDGIPQLHRTNRPRGGQRP